MIDPTFHEQTRQAEFRGPETCPKFSSLPAEESIPVPSDMIRRNSAVNAFPGIVGLSLASLLSSLRVFSYAAKTLSPGRNGPSRLSARLQNRPAVGILFVWRVPRFLLSVSALLTFVRVSAAPGQPGTEGSRPAIIRSISIEQRQVFDESDSTFIQSVGKLANSLHVMTDEEVIRRELLFKEGDPYDQRFVDESARHLRRLGILGGIRITADTLPDNTINVNVQARDRWTLRPAMSVRQGGGVSGFNLGLREENLFGSGQKASVGYSRLSDRRNPNGGELGFTEPRLFGSWWSGALQYRNADELRLASLDAQHPFFADTATWAARASASVSRIRMRQYDNGAVTSEGYLDQENELAWAATSSGSDTKLQLAAAYYRMRSSTDSFQVRPFDNVDLVIGALSVLHREYYKGSFIENFGRVEDVPLGYQFGVALGRNLHLTSAGDVDYFVRFIGQENFTFSNDLFASYQASVTSYTAGNEASEMTVMATALHTWRVTPHQTLIGRVTTTIGSHWSPTSQLILGSSTGLRGYRNFQFSGQRLLVLNLEDRAFSGLNLWFLRLGGSFFFDSGVVWNQGEMLGGQKFHSSVGLGLRIESSKSFGTGIFRFDIAYNFDQRRIAIILSTDHFFRGFTDMEFVPPVPGML